MLKYIFRFANRLFHWRKIRNVKDYIEGRKSESDFFLLLRHPKPYERLYRRASWDCFVSPLVDRKLIFGDLKNLTRRGKIGLQTRLCAILDYYSIKYTIGVPELALWEKWERYIPSFLDPSLELIDELEEIDPKQKHTIKWHKERFHSLYPYIKRPPRWLQGCEWPVDENGKRCVFLYQSGDPNYKDFIRYYFKNTKGEEIVVEQFD